MATPDQSTPRSYQFSTWMAAAARICAGITALLMAYYFLLAEGLTAPLMWSIIASQALAVIAYVLWMLTYQG